MADFTEVLAAIKSIAVADGALAGMLGNATQFYYGTDVSRAPAPPFIVCKCIDDQPNLDDSFWGDLRPLFQMDVVGTDPGALHRIVGRLDELFVIPFSRAQTIETTGWSVRSMLRRSAMLLPAATREKDGQVFQQLVTEWILKVTRKQ